VLENRLDQIGRINQTKVLVTFSKAIRLASVNSFGQSHSVSSLVSGIAIEFIENDARVV
jgi:hypothetical protein